MGEQQNGETPTLLYRERLWASAWLFLSTALVIPASLLVFLPIDFTAGVATAAVLYGGCVVLLIIGSPVIAVTDSHLLAGRAKLPIRFVGTSESFLGDEATLERGRRLDARAWLAIRGWVSPVVRVEVTDPDDPTPYWLVSTRHPQRLVEALSRAKADPSGA